jgi:hypothetical protein
LLPALPGGNKAVSQYAAKAMHKATEVLPDKNIKLMTALTCPVVVTCCVLPLIVVVRELSSAAAARGRTLTPLESCLVDEHNWLLAR